MDANESLYPVTNKFKQSVQKMGLINSFLPRHSHLPEVPTHQDGSEQIDYILITPDLEPFVKKGGILPLNYIHPSDHRTLFVDIDIESALQTQLSDLINPQYRTLRLNNAEAIKKYTTHLTRLYQKHKVLERLLELDKSLQDSTTPDQREYWIEKMVKLDQERTDYKRSAEKQCAKSHLTIKHPWSAKLCQAGQTITYWKGRKTGIEMSTPLRPSHYKIRQDYQIEDNDSSDLDYVKKNLSEAWKHKRSLHEHTAELLEEFLQELAEYHASMKNIKQESVVKQLKNAEKSRLEHQHINWFLKPHERGSVNSVLVPDGFKKVKLPDGTFKDMQQWREIIDSEELFSPILKQNSEALHGSKDSPFATCPLLDDLGRYGEGLGAEEILSGTYMLSEELRSRPDGKELSLFIQSLIHPNQTGKKQPDINTLIIREDFQSLFKETRERTSSSPSGIHMGHYKAAALDDYLSDVESLALTIPFKYGFSLPRWQQSIHAMLRKETLPYIHRLRIIQLFEADFNGAMKILYSRRMMPHGDKHGFSGEQAQGGRQGRTTHDLISNLQYTSINSELTRRPMTLCFNDQKGNFDRIRLNMNSVASRRMGMTKEATLTLPHIAYQKTWLMHDFDTCIIYLCFGLLYNVHIVKTY